MSDRTCAVIVGSVILVVGMAIFLFDILPEIVYYCGKFVLGV
jgi:hypothetical protein